MKKYVFELEYDKPQFDNTLNFSIVGAPDEKASDLQDSIDNFLNKNKYTRSGKKVGKVFDILGEKIGEYKVITKTF